MKLELGFRLGLGCGRGVGTFGVGDGAGDKVVVEGWDRRRDREEIVTGARNGSVLGKRVMIRGSGYGFFF